MNRQTIINYIAKHGGEIGIAAEKGNSCAQQIITLHQAWCGNPYNYGIEDALSKAVTKFKQGDKMKTYIYYDAQTNKLYFIKNKFPLELFASIDELKFSVSYIGEL